MISTLHLETIPGRHDVSSPLLANKQLLMVCRDGRVHEELTSDDRRAYTFFRSAGKIIFLDREAFQPGEKIYILYQYN